MRIRSVALTLIGPLAVTLAVAAPATAAIVAADPASVSTTAATPTTNSATSHSMSDEDMAAMPHSSAAPTDKHAAVRTYHRSASQGLSKIKGVVGPDYIIDINKSSVPAGKYKFIVDDRASNHNFHLTGAGVDEKTKVSELVKVKWKVTLTEGEYLAVCDPHAGYMRTHLTVTA